LRLAFFDEALDALETQPQIWSVMLAESLSELEAYLRLRPDSLERLAGLAQTQRLEVGAWFVRPRPTLGTPEILLRNLLIGLEGAWALGFKPLGVALPPFHEANLPQILLGLGLKAVWGAGDDGPPATRWRGADGSSVLRLRPAAPASILGEALGEAHTWRGHLRAFGEGAFFSRYDALINSYEAETLPLEVEKPSAFLPCVPVHPLLIRLLTELEPRAVYAQDEAGGRLRHLARPLQALWRQTLKILAEDGDVGPLLRDIEALDDCLPSAPQPMSALVEVASDSSAFTLTALKPCLAGKGLVLRGYNPTGEVCRVQVTLWRPFDACQVLRLDETPTGARLALEAGRRITFQANPYRLVTFGFT
jgi:hypothetical protein